MEPRQPLEDDAMRIKSCFAIGTLLTSGGLAAFVMDNPHIDWLAARSASVGALGGAEVYKALGAEANMTYWSDVPDGRSPSRSRPATH